MSKSCVDTYALRERAGVREYKGSSYFMHVPKRLRLRIFNKSKKPNVGWVSDSVTQHLQVVVGLRCTNPTLIFRTWLKAPIRRRSLLSE
jgi:hypothetical protein